MWTDTIGVVQNITITQFAPNNLSAFIILQVGPSSEAFTLWSVQGGTLEFAPMWIARSLIVSLLREAMVNNLQVVIGHDDTSSNVSAVQIGPQGAITFD